MGAFKQFLSSDRLITPFIVNKGYNFEGSSSLQTEDYVIERLYGINTFKYISSGSIVSFSSSNDEFNTFFQEYPNLIYNSIKHLYYSNYISSSYGDEPLTASILPGSSTQDNTYYGGLSSQGRYDNYLQTDILFAKSFPTSSSSILGVFSIPSKLYGENIFPHSFYLNSISGSLIDDGEGNIVTTSSGSIVGNIFYTHGIITLFGDSPFIDSYITSSNITCSFSSSFTIYETQYKCTIDSNEFNISQNPSLLTGSIENGNYQSFITGSDFKPYITTVGLYNEQNELLMIGKLSFPLPKSNLIDTTILINIDK